MTRDINSPDSAPHEHTYHILIVEDNISQRLILADSLRLRGFIVHEAATADEASRLLASPLLVIHLVIVDLWLPGMMSGFDLTEYVRYTFPELPLIITSGIYKQAPESPYTVFLQKPYSLEDISIQISKLLQNNKKGEQ